MMPYGVLFDKIKSALEDYDRNEFSFKNLHFRSGNESRIQSVSNCVKQVLNELELIQIKIDDGGIVITIPTKLPELSQALMFLVLNTDVKHLYDIAMANVEFAHVINICPTIPIFLFIAVVWECSLADCFYELLSCGPPWFCYHYFDAALESLKYCDDIFMQICRVKHLLCAMANSIVRVMQQQVELADKEYEIITVRYMYYIGKLLLHCLHPNNDAAGRFKKLKKREKKRYTGFTVKYLLEAALYFAEKIENPTKQLDLPNMTLYNIKKYPAQFTELDAPQPQKLDFIPVLLNMYMQVQNTLQSTLMLVDIDMYLSWNEIVETAKHGNLQADVGMLSFELATYMSNHERLKHGVDTQLQQFAVKPETIENRAKNAPLGSLLHMIDGDKLNPTEKSICLNELFKRTIIFGNDECLETIQQNIKLLTANHCILIIDYIKLESNRIAQDTETNSDNGGDGDDESDDHISLIRIIYKILEQLSNADVLQVLCARDVAFEEMPHNFCVQPDFKRRSNIFWNYLEDESFNLHEFLLLDFEQPWVVWRKFFDITTRNSKFIDLFLRTYSECVQHAQKYVLMSMDNMLGQSVRQQNRDMIPLCVQVYLSSYSRGSEAGGKERKAFWDFIIKRTHAELEEENSDSIDFLNLIVTLCKSISHAVKQQHMPRQNSDMDRLMASMLRTLVPILDWARWVPAEFSEKRAELLNRTCDCVLKNCNFLRNEQENTPANREFLRDLMILPLNNFTRYYLARISDRNVSDFYTFMTKPSPGHTNYNLATIILCCTHREMRLLSVNANFLEALMQAVEQIHHICSEELRKQAAYDNYIYIYQFVSDRLLKYINNPINRHGLERPNSLVLADRIGKLITNFPDHMYIQLLQMSISLFIALIASGLGNNAGIFDLVKRLPPCPQKTQLLERLRNLSP